MTDTTKGAIALLQRGVLMDSEKRYTEALVHYQEGLQLLLDSMKYMSDSTQKKELHKKVEEYMSRAEKLKHHINEQKELEKYHEQIKIKENSKGNSYKTIFGRFLDENVEDIVIEDAYIITFYQCQNFVKFCELAVKSCKNLKKIVLITTKDNSEKSKDQENNLGKIFVSLGSYGVTLIIKYHPAQHDRQITLSNGWIIKIGRGLNYFKAPEDTFALGVFDMDLRACHETDVNIYHKSGVRYI